MHTSVMIEKTSSASGLNHISRASSEKRVYSMMTVLIAAYTPPFTNVFSF